MRQPRWFPRCQRIADLFEKPFSTVRIDTSSLRSPRPIFRHRRLAYLNKCLCIRPAWKSRLLQKPLWVVFKRTVRIRSHPDGHVDSETERSGMRKGEETARRRPPPRLVSCSGGPWATVWIQKRRIVVCRLRQKKEIGGLRSAAAEYGSDAASDRAARLKF